MRKKQPMFSKSDLKFIGWVFAIMLLCCLPFLKVYGASYNHLKYFSNSSRLDSVIIIITEDGTPTSTTVIGTDTTLVLNDIYDYYLQYLWFWDGLDEYVTDGEYIKFTAGVATVDYDSIAVLIAANAGSGSGSDTVIFYAVDTSGTDTLRNDVKLTVKDSTGTNVATGITSGNGNITFYLDPNGYSVVGRATGYIWNSTSVTVAGNSDSVAITGYNVNITSPLSASLATIYGYVRDASDNPIYNAVVTITRNNSSQVVDTTDGGGYVIVSPDPIIVYSDTAGFWSAEIRRTTAYSDTTRGFYDVIGNYGGKELFKIQRLYVPGSGNVNVGDTLNQRIQ